MYSYDWDPDTGGLILNSNPLNFSKEPRPVYYKELDMLGFDDYWNYEKDDTQPYMWAEANNYWYRGKLVAKTKGGALFTKPEIIIVEEPELNGKELQQINVRKMVEKNQEIVETLTQTTIKDVFEVYSEYRNLVDIFHVSYSGGKDSEVTLDIVKKALPHNEFVVLFGDTGMEFSDTYNTVMKRRQKCEEEGISFYIAKADKEPHDTWQLFGPPSTTNRWCCSVHKTAPQLLKLREITGKKNFKELAFVGVRGDESLRRSGYDFVSYGRKHRGQYSCNPILNWNSAEVYLYIYQNNLELNDAYKKGNSRAGCLVCPGAANKNDYMNYHCYEDEAKPFIELIRELNSSENGDEKRLKSYLENNGWKARKNGRDISIGIKDYIEEKDSTGDTVITLKTNIHDLKEWMKTVGYLEEADDEKYNLIVDDKIYEIQIVCSDTIVERVKLKCDDQKSNPTLFKRVKNVLKKSHCCVFCRTCEANCPYGNIQFSDGMVVISDECVRCGLCHEIDNGCLIYDSLWMPKGEGKMKKSIDSYANHAPKIEWIKQYINLGSDFNQLHTLGGNEFPAFKRFLRDSGILDQKNERTKLAELLDSMGESSQIVWALMLTNLAYSNEVGWLIRNLEFDYGYTKPEIVYLLNEEGVSKSAQSSVPNAFRRISLLPLSSMGFGEVEKSDKEKSFILYRKPWENPIPEVILYSLYKFAEECGEYYQFTLTRLLDHDIDSDGVSPTQIFGLDRETMEKILNGLSVNHPEFIQASFTLDLDTITLRSDKTSDDVLELF